MSANPGLMIEPLTPARWPDLEALFGERGAYGGCWCMYWRLRASDWSRSTKATNQAGLRALVRAGPPPGLIAYVDGVPAGWVSVGPREAFPRIERSRTLVRVDERLTWSVNCFFVAAPNRGTGLMQALLEAAVAHAQAHGAEIVEGYPRNPRREPVGTMEGYVGISSVFQRAGFRKRRRRIRGRDVYRYQLVCAEPVGTVQGGPSRSRAPGRGGRGR